MTTGEKIAILRKKNEISQEQFAALLQVSRQSVSRWEKNLAFPEVEKLIKISKLFHCSVDYLLSESIKEQKEQLTELSVNDCFEFIQESGFFFLATEVNHQPRLRPFGMILANKDILYIATDKRKQVYSDLEHNPNVELASYKVNSKKWIRITGKAILNTSIPLREEMMKAYPMLRQKYQEQEEEFFALYEIELRNATIY